MSRPKAVLAASATIIRGVNDNGATGEACLTDAGAVLPSSTTAKAGSHCAPLSPALAQVVRALARLMEEDEYLAAQVRPADHSGS